jgi:hypothetical protein
MPSLDVVVCVLGAVCSVLAVALWVAEIVRRDVLPELRYRRAWADYERERGGRG